MKSFASANQDVGAEANWNSLWMHKPVGEINWTIEIRSHVHSGTGG